MKKIINAPETYVDDMLKGIYAAHPDQVKCAAVSYTHLDVYKRQALWKIIPPEEGSDFCHRLVYHGRDVWTARTKPHCDKCCLEDICKKNI